MKNSDFSLVGKRVNKIDGVELVTGRAKFAADLIFPGMLHGYAARAMVSAGRLLSVDVSGAEKIPGVKLVLTGKTLSGPNILGILPPFDQPLLAAEEIRYAGESIAFVAAENKRIAKKAAGLIKAEIEPFPPILSPEEALKPEARKIHPNGNITFSRDLVKGKGEDGFAEAEVIVERTYETSFQEHAYLETEAVCVVPGGDGRITVYASCQSPFHLRGHIAANAGVPASRVKVVQAYTGGSFGGKDDVAAEIGSLAAIAAIKLGRPVSVSHDREESIIGSNLRHAARINYKTGAKKGRHPGSEKGGDNIGRGCLCIGKSLCYHESPHSRCRTLQDSECVYPVHRCIHQQNLCRGLQGLRGSSSYLCRRIPDG